jgi:DNA helicase-2/ATP-dependent DNA helicase PcrA
MLIAGVDVLDSSADAVTLMTLHNAKGLEFPMVIVAGLEDGLFPLGQSIDEPAMLEEERRLFYVGVTRAEKKLYLTHAETRRRNGETMPSMRSRFLKEIPSSMLEERKTIKLRSLGRRSMFVESPSRATWGERAVRRNHGAPEWRKPARDPDIDASQDEAQYVRGERIKHKLFGGGTIAELAGVGRDVKAVIDFDDENVGRKTIKLAYTTLERGLG